MGQIYFTVHRHLLMSKTHLLRHALTDSTLELTDPTQAGKPLGSIFSLMPKYQESTASQPFFPTDYYSFRVASGGID